MKTIVSARCALALAVALSACPCAPALAQTKIPVEDFAKRPEAFEVSMSPTGEYVAFTIPSADGLETRLEISNVATGKTQVLRFGARQHVTDIEWTADDQIVVARAELDPLKARPVTRGELYTSDVRGKNQDVLFGFIPDSETKRGRRKDHGWAKIVMALDDEPGMALVDFTCWDCGEEPDTVIYKVNTRTGDRKEVEHGDKLADYAFDRSGEARIRTQWDDNDLPFLSYRPHKGDAWVPLPKSIASYMIGEAHFDVDNNTVYALVSDNMGPYQAYRIDLAAGTRTKLAGRDDISVAEFMFDGRSRVPFGVYYDAEKPSIQYINANSEWAKLHAGLLQTFPGHMIRFVDASRDGNKLMFTAWSDRDIGSYYIYDLAGRKIQKVIDYKSWLKPEQMAPTRPFSFTGPGGQKLYGFYTGKNTTPGPMVVMAHGGPFGIYDRWGFDNDAQFLASRGYSVLQVNYRGSGGRGKAFEESGWRGWGTKLQDDITAAVRWAIDNKLADPNRICTYGASFGGYSALIQPILHPDMYKCAIGYVGVYDLPAMRKTDANNGINERTQRFYDRTLGTDMQALAAVSPVQRVNELKVPVLLAHGNDDKTADFSQFKKMVSALKNAGNPAETFVASGEGHGFVKPENIAQLYKRIEAFLDKNIGH